MENTEASFFRVNRDRAIGIGTFLIVLVSGVVALSFLFGDIYYEREIRQVILDAYNTARPGGGRLSVTPYSPASTAPRSYSDLGRAQVYVLRHPQLRDRQMLQGMIYLGSG